MFTGFIIAILLLLIISLGLLMMRIHQFKQPRTIRWQIGHQIFTFQFPFNWLRLFSRSRYLTSFLITSLWIIVGLVIFVAVVISLFLFMGLLLPIILMIGLIMLILFLIFVL